MVYLVIKELFLFGNILFPVECSTSFIEPVTLFHLPFPVYEESFVFNNRRMVVVVYSTKSPVCPRSSFDFRVFPFMCPLAVFCVKQVGKCFASQLVGVCNFFLVISSNISLFKHSISCRSSSNTTKKRRLLNTNRVRIITNVCMFYR